MSGKLIRVWDTIGLRDGPGTTPKPHALSPGVLAYFSNYNLHCGMYPEGTKVGREPYDEWKQTSCPSLVIASHELHEDFIQPLWDLFEVFAPCLQGGTFESWTQSAKARLEQLKSEFGDELNLPALDAIDLTGLPSIFGSFRNNYYSIFQYHEPYKPARLEVNVGPEGWSMPLLKEMLDVFESGHEGAHKLERWWEHAALTVSLEAENV